MRFKDLVGIVTALAELLEDGESVQVNQYTVTNQGIFVDGEQVRFTLGEVADES